MILKLGLYHWGLKLYKVYINDDPGLTLRPQSLYILSHTIWHALLLGSRFKRYIYQRTNGPVNAHLKSGPSISIKTIKQVLLNLLLL